MMCLAILLLVAVSCPGQTTHNTTLAWTAPTDALPATTYNVYRAPGPCSPLPTFTKIAPNVVGTTYVDTSVIPGAIRCYVVTAVTGGAESVYSNTAEAATPSFAPGSLGAVPR